MVYQALRQAGLITYVTPETVHSAQRRDPLIAASLLTPADDPDGRTLPTPLGTAATRFQLQP